MVDWWSVLDNWDTWGVFGVLSALNLLVLLVRTRFGSRWRPRLLRLLRTIVPDTERDWLRWTPLLLVAALWFGGFTVYHYLSGQYGCLPNGLLSDPLGELDSGRAFWAGANPFEGVPYCGGTLAVPYGLAAVLLDAIGTLGGLAGILVVWGVVALSILPLSWRAASSDREYLTVYVATSILFVPLITSEFSGATNAIVPVTLLLTLYLLGRREITAAMAGGFLATARFPSVFPVLGATGSFTRRRLGGFLVAGGAFAAATAASYAVWGPGFIQSVFVSQATRRTYSLNFYGILLFHNALPTTVPVEVAQAVLTLALVGTVFGLVRSPFRAIALTIVGVALLTPFLAFNFLIWLLPVALAGARERWWLWGIASVGFVNANLGVGVWAPSGILWPSEAMDLLLSGLLLMLFLDLWREERGGKPIGAPTEQRSDAVEPASAPAPSSDRPGDPSHERPRLRPPDSRGPPYPPVVGPGRDPRG
jgi:hypothetical protein